MHGRHDAGELVGAAQSGPVVAVAEVVRGAEAAYVDAAAPVEKHGGAGFVELVHDVEVLHLVDVHGDERGDRGDPLGSGGHGGVEAHAVVVAAAAEPDYHQAAALDLADYGVVHGLGRVHVLNVVRHRGGGGGGGGGLYIQQ